MNAVLMPAFALLGEAVAKTAGPPGMRERVERAEAGELGEAAVMALRAEIEALARLLAPQVRAGLVPCT